MSQPPNQPPPPPGQPPFSGNPGQPPFSGNPGQPPVPGTPGQAPFPGNPGQAPQQGGPIPPNGPITFETPQQPPQAAGKSIGKRLIGAVVTLVVVIAGAIGFTQVQKLFDQKGQQDLVGKCVVVTGTEKNVDTKEIGCEEAGFHYFVANAVEKQSDCGENYTTITSSRKVRGSSTTVGTLCLRPEFTAGTCYAENSPGNEFKEIACTDPKAVIKISKILESNSTAECENPEQSVAYAEPAKAYCLVAPE